MQTPVHQPMSTNKAEQLCMALPTLFGITVKEVSGSQSVGQLSRFSGMFLGDSLFQGNQISQDTLSNIIKML